MPKQVPLTERQIEILIALCEEKIEDVDNTAIVVALDEIVEALEEA